MRPEAVVFVIALAVVVLIGVISRLRRGPLDDRLNRPFANAPSLGGFVLAALTVVAAGIGGVAILGGRVVAKAWHKGRGKLA